MTRVSLFRRRTDKALPQLDVDSPVMPCRPSFSTHAHAAPRLVRGSKTETVAARRSSLRSSTGGSSCSTRGGSPQRSNSPDVGSIRSCSKGSSVTQPTPFASSRSGGNGSTVLFGGKVLHQGGMRPDDDSSAAGSRRHSEAGLREEPEDPLLPGCPGASEASRRCGDASPRSAGGSPRPPPPVPGSADDLMAQIEREVAEEAVERRRQSKLLMEKKKTSEDLDSEFKEIFSSPQFEAALSTRESLQESENVEDWKKAEQVVGKKKMFIDTLFEMETAKQNAQPSLDSPTSPAGGKQERTRGDSLLSSTMKRVRTKLAATRAVNLLTGDLQRDREMMQEMETNSKLLKGQRQLARTRSAMVAAPASPKTPS